MNKRTRRIRATVLTVILVISMVLGNLTPAVLAAEEHVHDETCGYSDGQCVYETDETEDIEETDSATEETGTVMLTSSDSEKVTETEQTDSVSDGEETETDADENEENAFTDEESADAEDTGKVKETEEETDKVLTESATAIMRLSSTALTAQLVGEFNYNYVIYYYGDNEEEDGLEVVKGNYTDSSYTIPSKDYGTGHFVVGIGEGAFRDCTNLTSISFDTEMLMYIGDSAFEDCTGLTSVTIPSSVTSIGDSAFKGCTGLTSITIPSSVISIGENAFYGCTGLTSITILSGVTSIGSSAFYNCTSLQGTLTLPESLTSLESNAFSGAGYVDEDGNKKLSIKIPVSDPDNLFTLTGTNANIIYYYVSPTDVSLSSDLTVTWTGISSADVRYRVELYSTTGLSSVQSDFVAGQTGSTSYSYTFDTSDLSGSYYARVTALKPEDSSNNITTSSVVNSSVVTYYSPSLIIFNVNANDARIDTINAYHCISVTVTL